MKIEVRGSGLGQGSLQAAAVAAVSGVHAGWQPACTPGASGVRLAPGCNRRARQVPPGAPLALPLGAGPLSGHATLRPPSDPQNTAQSSSKPLWALPEQLETTIAVYKHRIIKNSLVFKSNSSTMSSSRDPSEYASWKHFCENWKLTRTFSFCKVCPLDYSVSL